nr:MAG TPA: hypothetical protein [Caudoviricetes sp.]
MRRILFRTPNEPRSNCGRWPLPEVKRQELPAAGSAA